MIKTKLENSPFWWVEVRPPDSVVSAAVATVIDGRQVAADVRRRVAADAQALRERTGHVAGLVTILVGEDPASQVYVRNKIRACEEAGMASFHEPMAATSTQEQVLAMVDRYNADDRVDGILVQSPLPAGLDFKQVLERIDPAKDVDGFHPLNMGRLVAGRPGLVACTPAGVMELLDSAGTQLEGADAVVVGRSDIVGKPVALLLLHRSATVTVCHSRTRDLPAVTRRADVLVAAVGRPRMITADMVKPGATVIDVGINRTEAGLAGDVDFDAVAAVAGAITPVPGGVGPMTIAMLLRNTVIAATARLGR
jgi:methylenetetrahydrofolate dehydrogenase (NADP+)/methenyltetrahydrofolate cyclohydrolase